MKTKLSVAGIGIGIILILLGFFEGNSFGSNAQNFFSGSTGDIAIGLLLAGALVISAGVLTFARAVSE